MEWVLAAVAILVLGLAALAAAGQLGSLPAHDDDVYSADLPAGDLTPGQLRATRFGVALRGYDMRQVDALLDRLAGQLERTGHGATAALPAPVETVMEAPPAPPVVGVADPADDAEQRAADTEVVTVAEPAATSGLGVPDLTPNPDSTRA